MSTPGISGGFVAQAIVSWMRNGHRPSETETRELNRLPGVDALRECIKEDDLTWLLEQIQPESSQASLYVSLLRNFTHLADVQVRLRNCWETGFFPLRQSLFWRLLDDPDLPAEWHEQLFQFVLSQWPSFRDYNLSFMGNPATVLTQVLRRLGNPSFPETKKWAYLCCLPEAAQDQEAAKALGPVDINGGKLVKPRKRTFLFAVFATVEVLPESEIPRLLTNIRKYP